MRPSLRDYSAFYQSWSYVFLYYWDIAGLIFMTEPRIVIDYRSQRLSNLSFIWEHGIWHILLKLHVYRNIVMVMNIVKDKIDPQYSVWSNSVVIFLEISTLLFWEHPAPLQFFKYQFRDSSAPAAFPTNSNLKNNPLRSVSAEPGWPSIVRACY